MHGEGSQWFFFFISFFGCAQRAAFRFARFLFLFAFTSGRSVSEKFESPAQIEPGGGGPVDYALMVPCGGRSVPASPSVHPLVSRSSEVHNPDSQSFSSSTDTLYFRYRLGRRHPGRATLCFSVGAHPPHSLPPTTCLQRQILK